MQQGEPSKGHGTELSNMDQPGKRSTGDANDEYDALISKHECTASEMRKPADPSCRRVEHLKDQPGSCSSSRGRPEISRVLAEPEHVMPDPSVPEHSMPAPRAALASLPSEEACAASIVPSPSNPAGASAPTSAVRWACNAEPHLNQRSSQTNDACRNQVMDFDDF